MVYSGIIYAEPVFFASAPIQMVCVVGVHLSLAGLGLHESKAQSRYVMFVRGLVLGLVTRPLYLVKTILFPVLRRRKEWHMRREER